MKELIIQVNESDLTPSEKMCLKGYYPVELIRCKDCVNWVPGIIDDNDDFIPPKCKINYGVGHGADDYCSSARKPK